MKKSVLFLFFLASFFAFSPSSAKALWTNPDCYEIAAAKDVARGWDDDDCKKPTSSNTGNEKTNMEGWSSSSMHAQLFHLSGAVIGVCETNCTGERAKMLYQKSGLGTTNKLIAKMYDHPPASFSYYAYDVLQNGGLVPKAYAQGIGFSGLTPILPIWKVFRNISYMFILVVLVAVGFMIMFRMKINPQTVISIQNALPGLIATIILITFSYAIAGLLIDLMYFVMRLVINIIVSSGITGYEANPEKISYLEQFYLNANAGDLFKTLFTKESLFAVPEAIFNTFWRGWIENIQNPGRGWFLKSLDVVTGFVSSVVSVVPFAVGTVLIALTLLFTFVRIFFILLNSYIQIILAVILAPFQLLIGVIPGKNTFQGWFLGLVGNLAVFPATVFIFLLGAGIANVSFDPNRGKIWVAPFIAGPSSDPDLITGLIGLGLVILTPSLLNAVKGAFQAKPVLPIGPGVIMQPISGAAGTAMQALQSRYYLGMSLKGVPLPGFVKKMVGIESPPPTNT